MDYGLFMMPLHDPNRDYTSLLEEDREAILKYLSTQFKP